MSHLSICEASSPNGHSEPSETIVAIIRSQPVKMIDVSLLREPLFTSMGSRSEAQAEVAGMDQFELKMDLDFKRAVYSLVERCAVSGYVGEGASYIDLSIDC